jgi:hypothetical protein
MLFTTFYSTGVKAWFEPAVRVVPEPSAAWSLALGLLVLAARRRLSFAATGERQV